jgi:hypothetical protein
MDVLDAERSWTDGVLVPVPLATEALQARPERLARVARLRESRGRIPATIRLLLDATTTCEEGVGPAGLELEESW